MHIDLGTTSDEDRQCKDLIGEAFEQAVEDAELEGCPYCGKKFPVIASVDLDVLWEKLMKVIGVEV
jgi:hypothetical protein